MTDAFIAARNNAAKTYARESFNFRTTGFKDLTVGSFEAGSEWAYKYLEKDLERMMHECTEKTLIIEKLKEGKVNAAPPF